LTASAPNEQQQNRTCRKCLRNKPITDFVKDKRQPTGYKSICRLCSTDEWKKSRDAHRQRFLEQDLYQMVVSARDRFLAKFPQRGDNECWEWHGMDKNHYGSFRVGGIGGINIHSHRAAYMIFKGRIPDSLLICHTCDNRRCVNPNHLYAGTYSDNNRDIHERARHPHNNRGENNGQSKYSERLIRNIFKLLCEGRKQSDVAKLLGVSPRFVSRVACGDRWKYVFDEYKHLLPLARNI
jgi:hypothetical protein